MWLDLHSHLTVGSRQAMIWAGVLALVMPAVLLISTAILADSIVLAILITTFYLALPSPSVNIFWRNLIMLGLSITCALVFAVFYLQARSALREVVWSGGSIGAAASNVTNSAGSFDVRTSQDNETLYMIDGRLNQNIFVGLAIEQLRSLPNSYENGTTIEQAMLAWVPRFLWPGKPERGGSSFVAQHTGLEFSEGTTFGAGPVFEFYVNFGYIGIAAGFFVLGYMVRAFDITASRALETGNLARFAQYQLAGIAILQPLADLFYVVNGLVAALLLGWGLRVALKHWAKPSPAVVRSQTRG